MSYINSIICFNIIKDSLNFTSAYKERDGDMYTPTILLSALKHKLLEVNPMHVALSLEMCCV